MYRLNTRPTQGPEPSEDNKFYPSLENFPPGMLFCESPLAALSFVKPTYRLPFLFAIESHIMTLAYSAYLSLKSLNKRRAVYTLSTVNKWQGEQVRRT